MTSNSFFVEDYLRNRKDFNDLNNHIIIVHLVTFREIPNIKYSRLLQTTNCLKANCNSK